MSSVGLRRLHAGRPVTMTSHSARLSPWLQRRLHDAAVTDEHLEGAAIWFLAGPLVAAAGWPLLSGWHAVGVLALVVAAPVVILVRWSGRRAEQLVEALADTVAMISRSLRSGASFSQALAETAVDSPVVVGDELRRIRASVDRGQPAWRALNDWAERVPEPEVRIVAAALALASENEASTTQALDGVSQSLRDRTALAGEIQALTAQASASMQTLLALPLAFLMLDLVTDQRTLGYLTTTSFGRLCLVSGAGLNVVGALWMRSIVRRRTIT